MSSRQARSNDATASASVASVDMKLEVSSFPSRMSIAQRSSIQGSGGGSTPTAPGSAQDLFLAVSDIEAAREELVAHGVDASEGFHCATGTACRFPGNGERISGPHPERFSYGRLFRSVVPIGSPAFNRSLGAKCPRI